MADIAARLLSLTCLASLAAAPALAQEVGSMLLPKLERTARSHALGDGAAVLDGLNALGVNPAGLPAGGFELLADHQTLLAGASAGRFAAAAPLPGLAASIALSFMSLSSPQLERRDLEGRPLGGFSAQEKMYGLHIARDFEFGGQKALHTTAELARLGLGLSIKFLQSRVGDHAASGLALDGGLRLNSARSPLSLGLAATNVGPGLRSERRHSRLPTVYGFSGALKLGGGVTAMASAALRPEGNKPFLTAGMEWGAASVVTLRGRYTMSAGAESLRGLAGGAGLRILSASTLDYAFEPLASGPAGQSALHRLTLTLRFQRRAERGDRRAAELPHHRGTVSLIPAEGWEGAVRNYGSEESRPAPRRPADFWPRSAPAAVEITGGRKSGTGVPRKP